jgi:F0F1-type ATP synthase delta subunit
MSIINEWFKTSAVRGLKEGGTAFIEEIASELNTEQLTKLISVLTKVLKSRKRTIDVKVG